MPEDDAIVTAMTSAADAQLRAAGEQRSGMHPGDEVQVVFCPVEWPSWLEVGTRHIVEYVDIRLDTDEPYLKLEGSPSTWRASSFRLVGHSDPDERLEEYVRKVRTEAASCTAAQDEADLRDQNVNHPPHYKLAPGVEVIDLTEQLDFLRGNAVKYLARAGRKSTAAELEDLQKARWYVDRAIQKLEKEQA